MNRTEPSAKQTLTPPAWWLLTCGGAGVVDPVVGGVVAAPGVRRHDVVVHARLEVAVPPVLARGDRPGGVEFTRRNVGVLRLAGGVVDVRDGVVEDAVGLAGRVDIHAHFRRGRPHRVEAGEAGAEPLDPLGVGGRLAQAVEDVAEADRLDVGRSAFVIDRGKQPVAGAVQVVVEDRLGGVPGVAVVVAVPEGVRQPVGVGRAEQPVDLGPEGRGVGPVRPGRPRHRCWRS